MKLKENFYSYLGMTKRNILLFFKDKSTLFFSMLSPLIVFFLYVVFLKNTYLSGIKESIEGLEEYVSMNDVNSILDSWLLAGILATSSITVALNSLHIMVSDKSLKIDYDYGSSPVKGHIVILSYFTGAFLNTLIINASILTVGLIVLNMIGNLYLSFSTILLLYLVTILASASATIIMMVIVSFFKKTSALAAFSGIVSAAVGFVVGAYIPLGSINDTLQSILSIVPGSHIACLYRNLLMSDIVNHMNISLNGVDNGMFALMINNTFSLNLNMFSYITSKEFMMIYTSASLMIAFGLNVLLYKKTMKRV